MVTIKDMLDSGVHFGHQTQRWNPKMKPYVFGDRRGIHIIDLQKTLEMTQKALTVVEEMAAQGRKMIFVGTKKQAVDVVRETAKKCQQFFVTKRWLGGTLTNFVTIKQSIDRLRKIDQMREKGDLKCFSKKEQAMVAKEYSKLHEYLEGIREMKEPPAMIFVVDVIREHIAVKEAKKLGVMIFGLCDTNSNPEEIDYPIPANDDAIRSIRLFCDLISDAYLAGAGKWEEKLRSQTDKESDLEVKKETRREKQGTTKSQKGPSVIKVNRGRKLVAAGTADEIEILHEVEIEAAATTGDKTEGTAFVEIKASMGEEAVGESAKLMDDENPGGDQREEKQKEEEQREEKQEEKDKKTVNKKNRDPDDEEKQ